MKIQIPNQKLEVEARITAGNEICPELHVYGRDNHRSAYVGISTGQTLAIEIRFSEKFPTTGSIDVIVDGVFRRKSTIREGTRKSHIHAVWVQTRTGVSWMRLETEETHAEEFFHPANSGTIQPGSNRVGSIKVVVSANIPGKNVTYRAAPAWSLLDDLNPLTRASRKPDWSLYDDILARPSHKISTHKLSGEMETRDQEYARRAYIEKRPGSKPIAVFQWFYRDVSALSASEGHSNGLLPSNFDLLEASRKSNHRRGPRSIRDSDCYRPKYEDYKPRSASHQMVEVQNQRAEGARQIHKDVCAVKDAASIIPDSWWGDVTLQNIQMEVTKSEVTKSGSTRSEVIKSEVGSSEIKDAFSKQHFHSHSAEEKAVETEMKRLSVGEASESGLFLGSTSPYVPPDPMFASILEASTRATKAKDPASTSGRKNRSTKRQGPFLISSSDEMVEEESCAKPIRFTMQRIGRDNENEDGNEHEQVNVLDRALVKTPSNGSQTHKRTFSEIEKEAEEAEIERLKERVEAIKRRKTRLALEKQLRELGGDPDMDMT